MNWAYEFDIVSVGSGAGGLAAAIVAARRGARALVIEKHDQLGGVTALSGGQIWIAPNQIAAAKGVGDSVDEALAYMNFLSAGFGDMENRRAFIERGDEAIGALCEAGFALTGIAGMPDYYFPEAPGSKADGRYLEVEPFPAGRLGSLASRVVAGHGGMTTPHGGSYTTNGDLFEAAGRPDELARRTAQHAANDERCMGAGIAANLVWMAREAGVEMWTSSSAIELIGESGVEGLVVRGPDGDRNVRAGSGVVLSTGSYEWNAELVETFEFLTDMYSLTLPTVTGDHFSLAAPFGAAIATTMPHGATRHVGLQIPGETWGDRPLTRLVIPGLPHCVLVNRHGDRFGDESFSHSYISALYEFDGKRQSLVNWPAWLVFDQHYRDKYAIGPIAPGEPLPAGMALCADSVGELAELSGIDPPGLKATVERFNAYSASGTDEEFGRGSFPWSVLSWGDPAMAPNPTMGPLDKPPFYAVPLHRVGTGIVSAGLRTGPIGQVLDVSNRPIDGLYALGNAAARIEMGAGYNSGMAIGRSLVFGYLCAASLTE